VAFSSEDVNEIKALLRKTLAEQPEDAQERHRSLSEEDSEPLDVRLQPDAEGWAEESEIILTSLALRHPICILSRFDSSDSWLCYRRGDVTHLHLPPTDPMALLLFHTGNHYDALINDAAEPRPPEKASKAASVGRRRHIGYPPGSRSEFDRRHAAIGVGAVGLALGLAVLLRRRAP